MDERERPRKPSPTFGEPAAYLPGCSHTFIGLTEEVLEVPLRSIEEIARHLVVVSVAVGDLPDRISVQAKQHRARIAKNDRGVGGNEKLSVTRCFEIVDDFEKRELPLWRKRRLRFVEDVDALLKPVDEEGQEGFTVGLLVERLAAVRTEVRDLFDVRGEVVKALSAHEEAFGDLWQPRETKCLSQFRAVPERREVVVTVATFGIESTALPDCFKKGRFAAAVFTDEEGDVTAELEVDTAREGADVERMPGWIQLLGEARDASKEGARLG